MSFVYGCNTIEGRRGSWEALRHISISIVEPWIVLGDFNTILFAEDIVNGMPVHLNEIIDCQNCITNIGLGQVNRKGRLYSRCNKRDGADRIYSHIDWVFGNEKWFKSYGNLEECSDHTPTIITTMVPKTEAEKAIQAT